MKENYKILSLDGGGSWSILQILTLKQLYPNQDGHEILQNFDMVIANSGGSIALAALIENYSLDNAIEIFKDKAKRESIFFKNTFKNSYFPVSWIQLFTKKFGPKYSAPKKLKGFQKLFPKYGKLEMKSIPQRINHENLKIIISTFNAYDNRAKFFRSFSQNPELEDVTLNEVIHGSSNAPVLYFDFPARFKSNAKNENLEKYYELWDGALGGFNNPLVAALVEAFKLGVKGENIKCLSIGTANKVVSQEDKSQFYDVRFTTQNNRMKKWKLSTYRKQLNFFIKTIFQQALTIVNEPPDWANYVAYMILSSSQNESNSITRMSPLIHWNASTDDKLRQLQKKLYKLDMDLTTDSDVDLLFDCFKEWENGSIMNQPIKYKVSRENEICDTIGDLTFNEALNKWKTATNNR